MTLRIRLMLRWAFFALPFQMRQCKRSTSATITAFAVARSGSSVDKFAAASLVCCKRIAIWNHVQNWRFRYSYVGQYSAQTRTPVGKSGHLGGVDPAHGFKGSLDQRGDVGFGPRDGAKNLA